MLSRIARRVIRWQVGVGVVGAVVWLVVGDPRHALAALAGGGIAVVLSLQTALRLKVRPGEIPTPAAALGAFLWAEIVKLVVAIGLLVVAAQVFRDAYFAVVTVFGAALAVYVIALRWPD